MSPIDLCILFSTADWDTPYWTNKQHTAKNFALRGIRVLYIESIGLRRPNIYSSVDIIRIFRRLMKSLQGVHRVDQNIFVLSPLIIPFKHHFFVVRWLNKVLLRYLISNFVKKTRKENGGRRPIVWSYHPYALDSIPESEIWPIIYHCVDDLSAIPGVDSSAFNVSEQNFLKQVDLVFTTSAVLFKKCKEFNSKVINFPNVVDYEHFSQDLNSLKIPHDLDSIPHPRIGYIGVLSDFKIDFKLLFDIVSTSQKWHFIFIGEERENQASALVAKLKLAPNAHFLGYVKYADLPIYMSAIDVGILPTLINSYTKSMFPMKYYEYIAAGIPVVSTPLDFLQINYEAVEIGYDAKTFKDAIEKQLSKGRLSKLEAVSIVGNNTWEKRLDKMIEYINGVNKLG